jgi:hypothetical protein
LFRERKWKYPISVIYYYTGPLARPEARKRKGSQDILYGIPEALLDVQGSLSKSNKVLLFKNNSYNSQKFNVTQNLKMPVIKLHIFGIGSPFSRVQYKKSNFDIGVIIRSISSFYNKWKFFVERCYLVTLLISLNYYIYEVPHQEFKTFVMNSKRTESNSIGSFCIHATQIYKKRYILFIKSMWTWSKWIMILGGTLYNCTYTL